jgi:RNA-directed DNA polymerase
VTWQAYGENLEERLTDLHDRIHKGSYRSRPARRTYIPQADGSRRPLAILCVEDKTVPTVLEAIYEEDFVGFSYGFRPGRGQHDALDALHVGILRQRVNWVLDADIRGFFDTMSHSWILRFIRNSLLGGQGVDCLQSEAEGLGAATKILENPFSIASLIV